MSLVMVGGVLLVAGTYVSREDCVFPQITGV